MGIPPDDFLAEVILCSCLTQKSLPPASLSRGELKQTAARSHGRAFTWLQKKSLLIFLHLLASVHSLLPLSTCRSLLTQSSSGVP